MGHENPIELATEPRHDAAIRQTRAKLFINYFQSLVPTLGRRLGSMGSIYHGEMLQIQTVEVSSYIEHLTYWRKTFGIKLKKIEEQWWRKLKCVARSKHQMSPPDALVVVGLSPTESISRYGG